MQNNASGTCHASSKADCEPTAPRATTDRLLTQWQYGILADQYSAAKDLFAWSPLGQTADHLNYLAGILVDQDESDGGATPEFMHRILLSVLTLLSGLAKLQDELDRAERQNLFAQS